MATLEIEPRPAISHPRALGSGLETTRIPLWKDRMVLRREQKPLLPLRLQTEIQVWIVSSGQEEPEDRKHALLMLSVSQVGPPKA